MRLYWAKKFEELWKDKSKTPEEICRLFKGFCEIEERKFQKRWNNL